MLRQRCPKRDDSKKNDYDAELQLSQGRERPSPKRLQIYRIAIALACSVVLLMAFRNYVNTGVVFSGPLPNPGIPDRMEPIPVFSFNELPSFERFYREFRTGDKPFVIRGIPREQQSCGGVLGAYNDSFLSGCNGDVNLYRQVNGWERKGCHQVALLNYTDFLKLLHKPGGIESVYGSGHYFAHGSNPLLSCPALSKHLRIPAYITGQMLFNQDEKYRFTGFFGSLNFYFSTKGMNQTFHVDVPKSELWSSVCRGRKYYRVIPRSIASEKVGWGDTAHRTLLLRPADWPTGMPIYHGEAGPGDLVYLPAGSMHAVSNLEETINLANDAVDVGNLGPISWVNEKIFRGGCWLSRPGRLGLCYPPQLDWMTDATRHTNVFDAEGVVSDASRAPRGFPTIGQLGDWGLKV